MATKKTDATVNATKEAKAQAPKVRKIKLDEFVDVQSNVVGKLIWKSQKTGYKIIWNEFGDINPMQVSDLLDMRNGARAFFVNNWVTLLGDRADAILDYLQVAKYYEDVKAPEDLDNIILGDTEDLATIIGNLSPNIKEALVYRARQLYEEGTFNDAKNVAAIKRETGVDISM